MNRYRPGFALLCAVVCGCGGAAQVHDPADSKTPVAPARQSVATEPGPQDPDAATEFTTTNSGLKYRVLRKGSGPQPTKSNSVIVNYKGWLDDGTVFDGSYGREPFSFNMAGGVIEGWLEGVTYVAQGGMIELEIPPQLGYGPNGYPPVIPPNATLHFLIELIEVQ